MKIISWNVNGLRAAHKKGLFLPMVEKFKPDIICLQETKAKEHQSEVDLPGYEEYWNCTNKTPILHITAPKFGAVYDEKLDEKKKQIIINKIIEINIIMKIIK